MTISEIINKTASIPGQSDKIAFLKENRSELLDGVFDAATKKYYLTSNSVSWILNDGEHSYFEKAADDIFAVFADLNARRISGNEAKTIVAECCSLLSNSDLELVKNIIDNNLKCGVSYDTYVKKVICKKSDKHEVPLADKIQDHPEMNVCDGNWFVSRKCDGVRCTARVDATNGNVTFISRQGKEFTTLENLKAAVIKFVDGLIGVWYLDGELCKVDDNGDEDFQSIMKEIRRKDYQITECCYKLFDIVPESVWNETEEGEVFEIRYNRLTALQTINCNEQMNCWCSVLKQERLMSEEDFSRWSAMAEKKNWEGFMVRKNIPFKKGRSKWMLKVKKMQDAEFKVVGLEINPEFTITEPGKGTSKVKAVGNLVIDYNGYKVGVGSGMTKEQRIRWVDHPEEIVGKIVTIQYFEETKNQDGGFSLRFPVLKYIYENERNI